MKKRNMLTQKKGRFRLKMDDINGWLFIAVALVIFSLFTIYPLISAVITSFQDYKPFAMEYVRLYCGYGSAVFGNRICRGAYDHGIQEKNPVRV